MERKENTKTISINPENGDVTEQIQKAMAQNNPQPTNRKQRRALAKQNKKREKKIQKYLERHPEAINIELDEEAIKKIEEEEKMAQDENIIDVPFTELADTEK